nr:MAG TPA: hypothetical protein [Caudoviricetes sp.]
MKIRLNFTFSRSVILIFYLKEKCFGFRIMIP